MSRFIVISTLLAFSLNLSYATEPKLIWLVHSRHSPQRKIVKLLSEISHPTWTETLAYWINRDEAALQEKVNRRQKLYLEEQDTNGNSALNIAAFYAYFEVVKILIQYGANLNHIDHYGNTALLWATIEGNLKVTKLLIKHGAELNHTDHYGNTALIWAVVKGRTQIVKTLLKNGADPEVKNKKGRTALFYARDLMTPPYYLLYYFPKLTKATQSSELKTLKANLLEDLKEVEAQDPHSKSARVLAFLLKRIQSQGKELYYQEKENEMTLLRHHRSEQPEQMEQMEQQVEQSCLVCRDDLRDGPPDGTNAVRCETGPAECSCVLCLKCAQFYAECELKGGGAELSTCPQCKEITQLSFFKNIGLDEKTLTRVTQRQVLNFNKMNPDYTPCPGVDCPGGAILDPLNPKESIYYICLLCDFKGYLQCGKDHANPCQEFEKAQKEEMELFMSGATQSGAVNRPCYYCGKVVHRIDGCNGIECPLCKNPWHWNFGNHKNHPRYEEHKNDQGEVHDDTVDEMHYVPLRPPHY